MKEMYLLKQSCLLLYTGAVFCQQEVGGMGCDLVSSPKFLTKLLALSNTAFCFSFCALIVTQNLWTRKECPV